MTEHAIDIVDQLRVLAKDYHQHRPHYTEAAAEITRLRAERDQLVAALKQINSTQSGDAWSKLVARAAIAAVEEKP